MGRVKLEYLTRSRASGGGADLAFRPIYMDRISPYARILRAGSLTLLDGEGLEVDLLDSGPAQNLLIQLDRDLIFELDLTFTALQLKLALLAENRPDGVDDHRHDRILVFIERSPILKRRFNRAIAVGFDFEDHATAQEMALFDVDNQSFREFDLQARARPTWSSGRPSRLPEKTMR